MISPPEQVMKVNMNKIIFADLKRPVFAAEPHQVHGRLTGSAPRYRQHDSTLHVDCHRMEEFHRTEI
jgi:hypothetical protein